MNNNGYLLTQSEARELLEPYARDFYRAIKDGFNDYITMGAKPLSEKAAKSHVVWDYVKQRMNAVVLKYNQELRMEVKRRMFFIVVQDKMAVKFKKVNKKYQSGNINTPQVNRFRNHDFKFGNQYLFPLEAGWNIDEYYSSITEVNFIAPNGKSYLWRIEFREAGKKYPDLFAPNEEDIIQIVTLNQDLDDAKTGS